MDQYAPIRQKLADIAKSLARDNQAKLDELKADEKEFERPDFVWHYLLQSFATMGRAAGWHGLIGNTNNYGKVTYGALSALSSEERVTVAEQTCRDAKVRMPATKARYIVGSFKLMSELGGPEAAKRMLLEREGRNAKVEFLKTFPGIGDKYARNIMMDVYHPDFRDSIAIDARIARISELLGLDFSTYAQHEEFYLQVARDARLNGWELDRLMFNFRDEFIDRLQ